MRRKTITLAVTLLLSSLSFTCEGFGISHPQVLSQIGQPMRVRARVELDGRDSDKVRVSMLPATSYAALGFGPAQIDPSRLRMRMEIDPQGTFLLIESDERILEPVVNLAIVLQAEGMRQSSLVSFMFDPPTTTRFAGRPQQEEPVAAPASRTGPDIALAPSSRQPALTRAVLMRAAPVLAVPPRSAGKTPPAPAVEPGDETTATEPAAAPWGLAGRIVDGLTGERMQRQRSILLIFFCGGGAFLLLMRTLNARMSLEDFDTWEGPHPELAAQPSAPRLALAAAKPLPRPALPTPDTDTRAKLLLQRVAHLEPQLVGEDSRFRRLLLVRAEVEAGHYSEAEAQLRMLEKDV